MLYSPVPIIVVASGFVFVDCIYLIIIPVLCVVSERMQSMWSGSERYTDPLVFIVKNIPLLYSEALDLIEIINLYEPYWRNRQND